MEHVQGSAGQSFACFLVAGMKVKLTGEANDYVGKGMAGGEVVIVPPPQSRFAADQSSLVGNTCLYGATGGRLFVNGRAGAYFINLGCWPSPLKCSSAYKSGDWPPKLPSTCYHKLPARSGEGMLNIISPLGLEWTTRTLETFCRGPCKALCLRDEFGIASMACNP